MVDFGALLDARASKSPDEIYLVCAGREWSFAHVKHRVDQCAAGLARVGIRKQDRVAMLVGNCAEFLFLWWGMWRLGAVMVPINLRLTAREIAYIVNHSEAGAVVMGAECAGLLPGLEKECPGVKHWLGIGLPASGRTRPVEAFFDTRGAVSPPRRADPEAPASILYTSGTTGFPKGVVHSQGNYLRTGAAFSTSTRLVASDRLLTANPLFHVNAQFYSALGTLHSGATFILMNKFSASGMWEWTRQFRANKVVLLLALATILYQREPRADDADNPVEVVVAGGVPKGCYRDFERRFGVRLQTLYSLSESPLAVLGMPDEPCVDGAVGRPMRTSGAEPNLVKVFDDKDRELPAGVAGEIVIRNAALMKEYYKSPQETANALRGGWLHTGDRGVTDENGLLHFLGRIKDVIRKKGENISAAEVEAVLAAHPGVAEAAVVGVAAPDAVGEEEILACIVWRKGVIQGFEALARHCAASLADFKVPRFWQTWEEFPKNQMNRVVKAGLKKETAGAGPVYDQRRK